MPKNSIVFLFLSHFSIKAEPFSILLTISDSNISPDATLQDILNLKNRSGHSTVAVTENGKSDGKLVGIVTSRDYRISRMDRDTKVSEFMTPLEKVICGNSDITLSEANDIIWDNKLNALPIAVDRKSVV